MPRLTIPSSSPFPPPPLPHAKLLAWTVTPLAAFAVAYPQASPYIAVAGVAVALGIATHARLRYPEEKPDGVMLLGHDAATGEEIIHDSNHARQHLLVIGGDESTRADYFADLLSNALHVGSGCILMSKDPDRNLLRKAQASCDAAGRAHDLLVLDFNPRSASCRVDSNSFNPFAAYEPDLLTQMLAQAIDTTSDGADRAMWLSRLIALLTGVSRLLATKRNAGKTAITARSLADHLPLGLLIEASSDPALPDDVRLPLRNYLASLPGFDISRGAHQRQATIDQHNVLQERLTMFLNHLDDGFPHIFRDPVGEIDITDVIRRRRILLVLLPDGDDGPSRDVGRLIASIIKSTCGSVLGASVEDTIEKWQPDSTFCGSRPFFVLLNGFEHYAVSGLAILAAQARSLNISVAFGASDIPAMLRYDDKEAKSVIANTLTKIYMRAAFPRPRAEVEVDPDTLRYRREPIDLRALPDDCAYVTFYDQFRKLRLNRTPRPGFGRDTNRLVPLPPTPAGATR